MGVGSLLVAWLMQSSSVPLACEVCVGGQGTEAECALVLWHSHAVSYTHPDAHEKTCPEQLLLRYLNPDLLESC
jgi:hypothetical protein